MNERVKQENKITDEELAATKRQLRRNLKEWQKNNTAIAKAKEEARKIKEYQKLISNKVVIKVSKAAMAKRKAKLAALAAIPLV